MKSPDQLTPWNYTGYPAGILDLINEASHISKSGFKLIESKKRSHGIVIDLIT